MSNAEKQNFVIARLKDYCRFDQSFEASGIRDPIAHLWGQLRELEEPLTELKQEILSATIRRFFVKLEAGKVTQDKIPDFLQFLDQYLAPGDYVDAAFQIHWESLQSPEKRVEAQNTLVGLRAHNLLEEDDKPLERRSKSWEKLVTAIYQRLGFDVIETCHTHKPLTARRLRFFLRRIRFNSSDFCAVFRFPAHEGDTFTPFILPRVEGLLGANRRILQVLRTSRSPS